MNARDVEFEAIRVRDMQGRYSKEHRALVNFGRWCGDRRGVFPKQPACNLGPHYKPDTTDAEGYGDTEQAPQKVEPLEPRRPIPCDRLPYDEKTALILSDRMHQAGGLSKEVLRSVKVAYVTREVPEEQFWKMAGCSHPDHFLERLETALRFVARFI